MNSAAWTATLLFLGLEAAPPVPVLVTEPPVEVRRAFRLAPFYKKYVSADGLPVVSSAQVSDRALLEARYLIGRMLVHREDIRQALIRNKVRLAVMAPTELTTDIPEHSDLKPKDYWDRRARGLGATRARPAVSCGEENLLNLPGDRYNTENILIHEFSHAIHLMGLNSLDPTFDRRLRQAYDKALEKGLWKKTYAATHPNEYWAEGVQSYFDCNRANDDQHNDISTREKLARYDPDLFALIDGVFKSPSWRYVRYDQRYRLDQVIPAGAGARVAVQIRNQMSTAVSIFWLNDGKPVLYRKLAAGEGYEQGTFVGHRWRAVPEGTKKTVEFTVPVKGGTWQIRE